MQKVIGGAASATAAGGWKKTMARRGKGTWCRSREKGDDVEAYVDDDEDDGDFNSIDEVSDEVSIIDGLLGNH